MIVRLNASPRSRGAIAARGRGLAPCLALALLAAALNGPASAQAPAASGAVSWAASSAEAPAKRGGRASLVLTGTVREGWHVYAFKQLPNGPTPLHVELDPNEIAVGAGTAAGSRPITSHDPAFDLDTPYYAGTFTVTVPVRIKAGLAAGGQAVPVSVRFQTCNGQICQPPKTLRLLVPIGARTGR